MVAPCRTPSLPRHLPLLRPRRTIPAGRRRSRPSRRAGLAPGHPQRGLAPIARADRRARRRSGRGHLRDRRRKRGRHQHHDDDHRARHQRGERHLQRRRPQRRRAVRRHVRRAWSTSPRRASRDSIAGRLPVRRAPAAVAGDRDRHRLRRRRQGRHRHRGPRRRRRVARSPSIPGRDHAQGDAAGQGQRDRRRRPEGRPGRPDAAPAGARQLGEPPGRRPARGDRRPVHATTAASARASSPAWTARSARPTASRSRTRSRPTRR